MKTIDRSAHTLSRALARVHDGQPWHGPSRAAILVDVSWEIAAWRPGPETHSIWDIVLHMRSWTREVTRRLGGGVPAEPLDGDWPAPTAPSADAWREALDTLDAAHRELVQLVGGMDDVALEAKVKDRPGDPPTHAISMRAMVASLAEHDIYHSGQIAMLKRLARTLR